MLLRLSRSLLAWSLLVLGVVAAPRSVYAQHARSCAAAFDLAQQLQDEGKYLRAREQFIACTRDVCPSEIRSDCIQGLSDVNKAAPSVVVGARDAQGRDLVSVRVYIDGQLLLERLDGLPTMVDPGPHTFRYEVAGEPAQEEQVVIRTGEKNRVLSVQFTGAGKPPPPPPSSAGGGIPTATWVLGGIAVVAFATEAVLGLTATSDHADCKDRLNAANACTDADVDAIETKYVIADVSLLIGLVSAGFGTYLFFADRASAPVASKPSPRPVSLHVSPTSGGGFARLGLRF